jgi:hypothetical protein
LPVGCLVKVGTGAGLAGGSGEVARRDARDRLRSGPRRAKSVGAGKFEQLW